MTGLENVNPNQFALPGMEKHSHPFASHLKHGLMVHFETEGPEMKEGGIIHHHYMAVHQPLPASAQRPYNPETDRTPVAEMEWAGHRDTGSQYPGEIQYIGNNSKTSEVGHIRGLAGAMYHLGNKVQFGQTTVPVHSPTRTSEGEHFSRKVGGPRPEPGDSMWRPPGGIHPYEAAGSQHSQEYSRRWDRPKQVKGQQQLPGMDSPTGRRKRGR